jgi:hypothetical protein
VDGLVERLSRGLEAGGHFWSKSIDQWKMLVKKTALYSDFSELPTAWGVEPLESQGDRSGAALDFESDHISFAGPAMPLTPMCAR